MTLIRRLAAETRALTSFGGWGPYADGTIPPNSLEGQSTAGQVVNESTTLQLIDAYACISLLEDSISMLPIDDFIREGGVRREVDPRQLIVQPDPEIELWEWVARGVGSLATGGNAYGYLWDRDRFGYPQRCTWIHPDDCTPRRNRETGMREYSIRDARLGRETLPASEVLHIPLVVMPGALRGLSPIGAAKRGLGLAMATEEYGAKWFGDGANPSSVLETDQEMDDGEAKLQQARWIASHGGRRRPAVLSGGLKWRQVQISPNESQFLETRKLNTAQVARIWRVPPHRIGDLSDHASQGGGKGLEEQGIGYVVFTCGPYLTRIEAALSSRKVCDPREGRYSKFNVGALLRGNTRDRYVSYAVGRQWGWLSVNDIRALEDMPPIEGGDVYLQPLNMIDAEKALQVLIDPNPGGQQ